MITVNYRAPFRAVRWDGSDLALAEIKQLYDGYNVNRMTAHDIEPDALSVQRAPWGWTIPRDHWAVRGPNREWFPFVLSDYDFHAQFVGAAVVTGG